jgi:hypothetical protein
MDFTANADIENMHATDINVILYYNRHFLDSTFNGDTSRYAFFLKNASDLNGGAYKIDTTNLVITHLLKPGQKLTVSHIPGGRTVRPEYAQYDDSIRVGTAGNFTTRSADGLAGSFQQRETRYWVWTVR